MLHGKHWNIKPHDYIDALDNLGNALRQLRRHDEAAEVYRRVLQLKPESSVAHYNLGVILEAMGQLDDAIAAYRTALRLDPRTTRALTTISATPWPRRRSTTMR